MQQSHRLGLCVCSGDYTIKRRADIQGQDVNCNAKNYKVRHISATCAHTHTHTVVTSRMAFIPDLASLLPEACLEASSLGIDAAQPASLVCTANNQRKCVLVLPKPLCPQGEKLPYCEVSGNPVEVAAACNANPSCKAFTTTGSSGGFLKTASGPATYTEGSTVWQKA